jgi:hypothetical protein
MPSCLPLNLEVKLRGQHSGNAPFHQRCTQYLVYSYSGQGPWSLVNFEESIGSLSHEGGLSNKLCEVVFALLRAPH